jgi:hypothetical protein
VDFFFVFVNIFYYIRAKLCTMNDQYIMYAPNGELQDSIQASGVIDISNLNRRQIKDLAQSAAG